MNNFTWTILVERDLIKKKVGKSKTWIKQGYIILVSTVLRDEVYLESNQTFIFQIDNSD